MAILGQNRVGPNQDVNNPTTLINLGYEFNRISEELGIALEIYNTKDLSASGDKITDIIIPLKLSNGNTSNYDTVNIDFIGGSFDYDKDLWGTATILTYVDLAETFRDYWDTLNNVLDTIAGPINSVTSTAGTTEGPIVINLGFGVIRTHGSIKVTDYTLTTFHFEPSGSFSTPTWLGEGPTNYTYQTYPQLLSQISLLEPSTTIDSFDSWDTTYWYDKFNDTTGSVIRCSVQFGKDRLFTSELEEEWVQIYNYEDTDIEVDISASISVTTSNGLSASAGVSSVAEIGDLNDFPDGISSSFASFQSDSTSVGTEGGTASTSQSRTITVPSKKSVFIRVVSSAGTTFFFVGGSIQISAQVDIEDQTQTNSLFLGV